MNVNTLLSSLQFNCSIIGISETWLNAKSPPLFALNGYKEIRKDRAHGRGGGVLMYISNSLSFKPRNDLSFPRETAECLCVEIDLPKDKNFVVCVVYRPPTSDVTDFLDDLESVMLTVNSSNKSVCFMGDFNIDLLSNSPNSIRFQNILDSNAFSVMIDKPTRISDHSSSLLDNIFIKAIKPHYLSQSGLFYAEISDHLPVFCLLYNLQSIGAQTKSVRNARKITDVKVSRLNADLHSANWDDVLACDDVERAFDVFWDKFYDYFDKNLPYEQSNKKKKGLHPWITRGILQSIKRRNTLYKNSIKNPSQENIDKYKKYRNKLTSIIRCSRKSFYSTQFERATGNMSSTWRVVKDILCKQGKSEAPSKIIHEEKEITSAGDVANAFNIYFANVGLNQAKKINSEGTDFKNYLQDPAQSSIFLQPTNCVEISKIVSSLKTSHSSGHDELSTSLLKRIIGSIVTPLVHICNLSLLTGVFPSSFKLAKVIPVHKKDNTMIVSNYRPISILPSFSKILERIVYNRLYEFFDQHKSLNPEQYGFRRSYSTDLALLKFYDRVSSALAAREHVVGVFMDLSKAFDTLDHTILLSKLAHYGVRGIALQWFSSYLTMRRQFTHYNSVNSDVLYLKCGVPQGSILGPLLFLIYINDICDVSNAALNYTLFADDTSVFMSHREIDVLERAINSELPKLALWFRSNLLSLNVLKTNFIHFKGRKSTDNKCLQVKLNGMQIERKTCTKFLGVYINENLDWTDHVKHIVTPISRNIGILYKVRYFVSDKILLMLYNTLILPYISYCNILWATCKTVTNNILLLQKKAIRVCTRSGFLDHTNPLFVKLRCLKVDDINFLQTAIFMFRFNNKLLPDSFSSMFQSNNAVHSYSTRQASNIHLVNPRTTLAHKSIRHSGPDVWNSLPQHVRTLQTPLSFKRAIKRILISKMC